MFGRAYPHSPSSGRVNNATPTAHTQITPRLLITSGTQMHDFSHRIPLREEGRLLRARDRRFESGLLQRRVHCELAWTRWAHIREFLMQEWWSYLTRCAPTSRFLRVWLRCSRGRPLARLRPATAHLAKPHAQHPVSRAAPFSRSSDDPTGQAHRRNTACPTCLILQPSGGRSVPGILRASHSAGTCAPDPVGKIGDNSNRGAGPCPGAGTSTARWATRPA